MWQHLAACSHPPRSKTHHTSSGCSAPCSSPLLAVTLGSPCRNFRACLRVPKSIQQQGSENTTQNHSNLLPYKAQPISCQSENPPPLLTGRFAWRFWLAREPWETWAPPLGFHYAEGTRQRDSWPSLPFQGQTLTRWTNICISIAPPKAYPARAGTRHSIHCSASRFSPLWAETMCSPGPAFRDCLSSHSQHSAGIYPFLLESG